MASGLNRVMLLGNLGADPEPRYGQIAEQAVLRIRLATTEGFMDRRTNERKERTDWHNVVVFGRRAEALQKILSKGSTILVEGRLQTSSYDRDGQKHYRTDVIANNVLLCGGRRNGAAGVAADTGGGRPPTQRLPQAPPPQQQAPSRTMDDFDDFGPANHGDDDIPF